MAANQIAAPWRDAEAAPPGNQHLQKGEIVAERGRNPPTAVVFSDVETKD